MSRYSQYTYHSYVPVQGIPSYFHILSEITKFSPIATIKQVAIHRYTSLIEAFFPILGSTFERFVQAQTNCFQPSSEHEDIKVLSQMLLSLQKSTEAYLGHEVHQAVVSVPIYMNDQRAKNIDCAMAINGLKPPVTFHTSYHTSSTAIARAGGADIADDEKSQMVLAIDHSRTHLMAELLWSEYGVFEGLRDEFNTTLGTNQRGSPDHWRDVQALIRRVTKAPFSDWYLDLPNEISRLILFGDQTEDPAFREVLQTMSLVGGTRLLAKPEAMPDPVFAPALGMALTHTMICKYALPWDDFDVCPTE
jgi:hypothetical protein